MATKRDAAADDENKKSRKGEDAQTAELDRQQQDSLPKTRELRANIKNRQAGDTTSGSDGKKSIDEAERRTGAGLWQHQTRRAGANQQDETDHEHARRITDDMQAKPSQRLVAPAQQGGESKSAFWVTSVNTNFSEKFKLSLGNG